MDNYLVKETIEALKIHLAEYRNTVWKTLAALRVSIGWLMSSNSARDFLSGNSTIRIGAIIIISIMAIMHCSTLFELYKISKTTRLSISDENNPLLLSIIKSYSIPIYYPYASFSINGLLFLCLLVLIY
jgi:hypothetical protein